VGTLQQARWWVVTEQKNWLLDASIIERQVFKVYISLFCGALIRKY
jgi:hypothetical protein